MRPHLVLRFTLGLLADTSAAIVIPRNNTADDGALQERTTIYFPGPIPGHSDIRAIHDPQVPAELASCSSSSDVRTTTPTELLVSEEDTGDNSVNNRKDSSKRAPAPSTTPKSDDKHKKKKTTDNLWPTVGAIVGVVVVLSV